MKYRIVERKYYDNLGELESQYYIIQVLKSYLGIKIWRTITQTHFSYEGHYTTYRKFLSIEKAQDYIENNLCKRVKERSEQIVVAEVSCTCK